ncbi:MAG: hypothetical protein KGI75_12135 [Rhizobiaceae bacterium]|nr:hypothetical protein [Rhizobiaceae bacterium]
MDKKQEKASEFVHAARTIVQQQMRTAADGAKSSLAEALMDVDIDLDLEAFKDRDTASIASRITSAQARIDKLVDIEDSFQTESFLGVNWLLKQAIDELG